MTSPDQPLPPYPYPTPPPTPLPQYPPYIPEQDVDLSHLPESALDGIHGDGDVVLKKPGELGPPAYPHGPDMTESPPGSGVWVPDHRPEAPGQTHPAGYHSGGGDTYPTTGDPATDEAIRQTFTNLRDIRDAHGTGQTPADGTFYTDAANRASGIQSDLEGVGRAAGTHWTGEAADMYQTINKRLAT
ncbi:hypothetical protein [Mycolicibacterium sphagni]|uniref:hypothetical protein n=1 Tax=Mycolicibacterium sphagni TaxID=1786 RepID=UPI0015757CDA|nr:hypothetical protein [Mycolicibacterium sphagni]